MVSFADNRQSQGTHSHDADRVSETDIGLRFDLNLNLPLADVIEAHPSDQPAPERLIPIADDATLMIRLQQGDSSALKPITDRYYDDVVRLCCHWVGRSYVEDIAQETFLRVYLKAHTFDPQRSLKNWIFTIAANAARSFARSQARSPIKDFTDLTASGSEEDFRPDTMPSRSEGALVELGELEEHMQRLEYAQRCLDKLPASLRVPFEMWLAEASYQEMSRELGIPEGTLKSRLHSARRKLAEAGKKSEAA